MKITVTGCDGFIGFHLALGLAHAGHDIIAACQHDPTPLQNTARVTPMQIDLTQPNTITPCLYKAECIIHCAALFDLAAPYETLHAVNVQGTANLLAAAKEQKVSRFIHFSTAEVYGSPQQMPVTEEHPLNPGTPYGRSKLASEQLVQAAQEDGSMQTVIFRPSAVYGPRCVYAGGLLILPFILREIGIRSLPVMHGNVRFNGIYIDDVVGFSAHLLNHDRGWNSVYNLADNDILELETFLRMAYRHFGFRAGPLIAYPKKMLAMCGRLGNYMPIMWTMSPFVALLNAYWRKICRRHQLQPILRLPRLDPCMLHFFRTQGQFVFDNRKIMATGYHFTCPSFDEGLGRMLAWYKANRWVP